MRQLSYLILLEWGRSLLPILRILYIISLSSTLFLGKVKPAFLGLKYVRLVHFRKVQDKRKKTRYILFSVRFIIFWYKNIRLLLINYEYLTSRLSCLIRSRFISYVLYL